MAKIPTSVFRGRISQDVPRAPTLDPSQAGASFRGLQALGQGIADVGSAIGNIQQRRQKSEDDSYVSSSKTEFLRDSAENEVESKKFYNGSNHQGYTRDRQEFIQGRKEFSIEGAPSQFAKEKMSNFFNAKSGEALLRDNGFENSQANRHRLGVYTEGRNQSKNSAFKNADLEFTAPLYAEHVSATIDNENFDPARKITEFEKDKELIKQTLEGMRAVGSAPVLKQGLDFINGRSKFNRMFGDLNEDDKARFKRLFEKDIEELIRKTALNSKTSADNIAGVISIAGMTPEIQERALEEINNLERVKLLSKKTETKNTIDKSIENLKEVIEVDLLKTNAKHNTNLDDANQLKDLKERRAKVKTKGEAKRQQRLEKFLEDRIEEKRDDPRGLALKENPGIKEGSIEGRNIINNWGMTDPILSKARARQEISILTRAPDRLAEFNRFRGEYELADEWLHKTGGFNSEIAKYSLSTMLDETSRQYSLMSKQNIQKVKDSYTALGGNVANLKRRVNNGLDEVFRAYPGIGNAGFRSALSDTTLIAAMATENTTAATAAREGIKEVIDNNFRFIKNGDTSLPIMGEFAKGQNFNRLQLFVKNINELGFDDPRVIKALDIDPISNTFDSGASIEKLMKAIAVRNPKLELSGASDSFVIMYDVKTRPNARGDSTGRTSVKEMANFVQVPDPQFNVKKKQFKFSDIIGTKYSDLTAREL